MSEQVVLGLCHIGCLNPRFLLYRISMDCWLQIAVVIGYLATNTDKQEISWLTWIIASDFDFVTFYPFLFPLELAGGGAEFHHYFS